MTKRKIGVCALSMITLLIFHSFCFAEPSINSVTGTISHGGSLAISGSSFGSKSRSGPLVWDDGEGQTVNDYTVMETDLGFNTPTGGYSDVWPPLASAGPTVQTQYRDISSWGRASAPHQYSTKYIAGCHYQHADNNPAYIGGGEGYRNVGLVVDNGSVSDKWYVRRYYTLDPAWRTDWCSGNNHKFSEAEEGSTMWSSSPFNYLSYRASHSPCIGGPGETVQLAQKTINVENPRYAWIAYEEIYDKSRNLYEIYINNKLAGDVSERIPNDGARAITIGGYYRRATSTDTSSYRGGHLDSNYRYFDDIYMDTTLARVMLCTSSTYPTGGTQTCEPQIPSAWGDNTIACTVNLGRLSGETAYLFVFDANNNHNRNGYPVSISGGGSVPIGGGGSGNIPGAPTNLRVETP